MFIIVRKTVSKKVHVVHDIVGFCKSKMRAELIADDLNNGNKTAEKLFGITREAQAFEVIRMRDLDDLLVQTEQEHMKKVIDNADVLTQGDEP